MLFLAWMLVNPNDQWSCEWSADGTSPDHCKNDVGCGIAYIRHPGQLTEIDRHVGNARVISLTGVPGSGKSTLVQSLTKQLLSKELRVGIVSVQPSSLFTGGAIMGDSIPMG